MSPAFAVDTSRGRRGLGLEAQRPQNSGYATLMSRCLRRCRAQASRCHRHKPAINAAPVRSARPARASPPPGNMLVVIGPAPAGCPCRDAAAGFQVSVHATHRRRASNRRSIRFQFALEPALAPEINRRPHITPLLLGSRGTSPSPLHRQLPAFRPSAIFFARVPSARRTLPADCSPTRPIDLISGAAQTQQRDKCAYSVEDACRHLEFVWPAKPCWTHRFQCAQHQEINVEALF